MSDTVLRLFHVESHLFLITDYEVDSTIITIFAMKGMNPGEIEWFAASPKA